MGHLLSADRLTIRQTPITPEVPGDVSIGVEQFDHPRREAETECVISTTEFRRFHEHIQLTMRHGTAVASIKTCARRACRGRLGNYLDRPLPSTDVMEQTSYYGTPGREVRFAADSPVEGNGFELSVPRCERNESLSGTGTVTEATKVRLEAVAYLSGYRWALTLDPR